MKHFTIIAQEVVDPIDDEMGEVSVVHMDMADDAIAQSAVDQFLRDTAVDAGLQEGRVIVFSLIQVIESASAPVVHDSLSLGMETPEIVCEL